MTTSIRHPFDEAIQLSEGPKEFIGKTSAHYANMVGPFGERSLQRCYIP